MHYLSVNEPAIIKRLISVLHKGTGEVLKKKPRFVDHRDVKQAIKYIIISCPGNKHTCDIIAYDKFSSL